MKICLSFALIFLLLISQRADSLIINEVYPKNPEWVELYNPENEEINISKWRISDNAETDNLTCYTIPNCSPLTNKTYILIIDRNTNISNITNESIEYYFVDDKQIGKSLNDDGDNLTLFDDKPVDTFNFTALSDSSKSWGRFPDGAIDLFLMSPSPGHSNFIENETKNQTNSTTNSTCDLHLRIECDDIFTMGSNDYRLAIEGMAGGDSGPEVEYWIEDMFGDIIRHDKTNNTDDDKSWTPPKIIGTEAYFIRASISDARCNDANISNNHAEKMIVVKGSASVPDSSISIIDIGVGSDGKAKFGDVIEIKINAYKGGTSKSAVDMWLENAEGKKAGEANFNLYSKYTNYSFSIPLQINPNCGSSLPNGSYMLKIEGVDSHDEDAIIINGTSASSCKVKTVEISNQCSCPSCPSALSCKMENSTKNTEVFEIIAVTTPIFIGKEFETRLRINATKQINYTIFSYVYNGNKLLSLGFDGKEWLKTWDANKKEIGINETTVVSLINRVANDTEPGNYKLRVRILYDGKEHDVTRDISITEQEEGAGQIIVPENTEDGSGTNTSFNGTEKNRTGESKNAAKTEIKTPTGRIVSEKSDNWFSSAVKGVIDFFKNLFKL